MSLVWHHAHPRHVSQVPMLDAAIPLIEERAIFYREVFSGTHCLQRLCFIGYRWVHVLT